MPCPRRGKVGRGLRRLACAHNKPLAHRGRLCSGSHSRRAMDRDCWEVVACSWSAVLPGGRFHVRPLGVSGTLGRSLRRIVGRAAYWAGPGMQLPGPIASGPRAGCAQGSQGAIGAGSTQTAAGGQGLYMPARHHLQQRHPNALLQSIATAVRISSFLIANISCRDRPDPSSVNCHDNSTRGRLMCKSNRVVSWKSPRCFFATFVTPPRGRDCIGPSPGGSHRRLTVGNGFVSRPPAGPSTLWRAWLRFVRYGLSGTVWSRGPGCRIIQRWTNPWHISTAATCRPRN